MRPSDNATKVRPQRPNLPDHIIKRSEFRALLEATVPDAGQLFRADQSRALLWGLLYTGFRASELLGLRVGSLVFEGDTVRVSIPNDAPDLKTGPRTIYVAEATGALQVWGDFHPANHEPSAPLWIACTDKSGHKALTYNAMLLHLRELQERAGITAASRGKLITPQDFRHSCATREAVAGWVEAALRPFFGWSRTSDEPSRYIHLAQRDLEERVRKDAEVDGLGARERMDPLDVIRNAVSAAVEETLRQRERPRP